MSARYRLVFDCNVFLQALSNPSGPAGRCMQLVLDGNLELFVSTAILDEFRAVATRPRLVQKLRLTSRKLNTFLNAIVASATLVRNVQPLFTFSRDPSDAHYVNLAIAVRADLIVTRDRDLLDLFTLQGSESVTFRSRYPQLRIIPPEVFLAELSGEDKS